MTVGGGRNHRLNLAAMVLLKENHIAAAGGVTTAIDAIRRGMARTGQKVETDVEVQTVAQAVEALDGGARWIMLDNMPVADIEMVVKNPGRACRRLPDPAGGLRHRPSGQRPRHRRHGSRPHLGRRVDAQRARAGPDDAADDRPGAMPEVVVIDACQRQGRGGSPTGRSCRRTTPTTARHRLISKINAVWIWVGSDRGAVLALRPARFPGSLAA